MKKVSDRSVSEQSRCLGLALRVARQNASMSQSVLAQAAVLSERTIRRVEQGES